MTSINLGIVATSLGSSGGGVSTVIGEHINNMPQHVIVSAFASNRDKPLENIFNTSCNVHLSYSPLQGRLSFFPGALQDIQIKPLDVVHQHGIWGFPSLCGLYASKIKKTPLIISPHGMLDPWILARGRNLKTTMNFLFQRSNIAHAHYLHALNLKEAAQIRDYGYEGDIIVIPNGVTKKSARTRVFCRDNLRVIYLGRIDQKKNVIELAQAIKNLSHSGLNIKLDIYGWGNLEYQNRLILEINNQSSISFHGPVYGEAKEKAFLEADVFVLPSQSEGLPMAALEAWSYGVPCILSENCNLPEGFSARAAIHTGITADDIASSLNLFYNLSSHEAQQMSNQALDLVSKKFTWSNIMNSFATAYAASCNMHHSEEILKKIIFEK